MEGTAIWAALFPYIVIIVIFYIFLIIPQRRKEKQFREMIASLKDGDRIVTIGGIVGKIVHIDDNEISIETGLERTKIRIAKWAVKNVEKPEVEAK